MTQSIRDTATPIFVVGASRSGTTMVRLMLNQHPDVTIPSESHFIVPFVRTFGPRQTLNGEGIERAVAYIASSPEWQRDFAQTEDELRNVVGENPIDVPTFVDRVFRLEIGSESARWGDKTPANLMYVDLLLEAFPRAHVIAVVRDPRDVYISLKKVAWYGTTTWDIGRYIARNGAFVERWSKEASPEQFSVVRYEDLVLETEETLRRMCAQLDLGFRDEMSAFFHNTAANLQPWEFEAGIHEKLLRAPSDADVGRWRREVSRRDRLEVEALTGEVLDRHGYEVTAPVALRSLLRVEARARHHARSPVALVNRSFEKVRGAGRRATSGRRGDQPSRSG